MSTTRSAVIVGAGIGGITTAIYLAKKGIKVTVFEKNSTPGGRCGQTLRDGHRFDLGATIFLMPDIYRKVFASLDLSIEEFLETKPLETLYKIHFDDGSEIDFTTDKKKMEVQLESLEPGSFAKSQTYISKGYELFEVSLKELLGRNFYHLFDFVSLKNAGLLIKLKTYIKHHRYIQRFFKHPHLRMAYTFQNIYIGQSPYDSPALFSMLPAAELTEGSLFPVGGMYQIVENLISLATTLGVQFQYNKTVTKILIDGKRTKGIRLLEGTEVEADIVVANADLPYVYRELLPDKKRSKQIDKMKFSCSAIVFHWALDKVYPQLSHHNVFLSADYKGNLDKIFHENSMADEPSFYVHAPVRTDPSAAPPNEDSLSVIVPVGNMDEKRSQNWNNMKNTARASVIERLKAKGLEDIEQHIKFEICYLPNTWKNNYNVSRGATFGSLNHSIMQMGYFRPHNKHNVYQNVYFVGGSTHPGNGIPLVLLSAKLTSERILKDIQQ